jgi:serine-type D-Ala-D-Ala carboxypeptidase (penicillin-binding protein 5/6)
LKTGFTNASGYNLVTSVDRDGHRLVGVVLGGKSGHARDEEMKAMLDRHLPAVKPVLTPKPAAKASMVVAKP